MPFHTERLTCKGCGAVFIVGGERIDMPGDFHFFHVECPRCHAKVDTTWDGEVRLDTLQVMADEG
jgi:ribosomal protein S27AE